MILRVNSRAATVETASIDRFGCAALLLEIDDFSGNVTHTSMP
jgi:hypothetical protein